MAAFYSDCPPHRRETQLEEQQRINIAALEAKVRELEDKLRFKQMDCDTWQRDAEGKLEDRTRIEHELTASRQQVERLVEALEKIKLYRAHNGDTWPADVATEALAAVERERT